MVSTRKDLYIITVIYNPFGFESRYRLYRNFAKHMEESGAKLFTIEAAFGDKPYVLTDPDNPMHMQVRTDQILWHKERLFNLAYEELKHRVPDLRFVGLFDSDITFTRGDWVAQAVHALTYLSVVQPFAQAVNLDAREEAMWTCPSTLRFFIEGRGFHQDPPIAQTYTYGGHPGLAWCFTREALDRLRGLYDLCVAGSADSIMANAFKGDISAYLPGKPTQAMIESMSGWANRAQEVVRGRVGFTRGSLLHHWHGASEKRGYEKRWDILSFHRFDPTTDVVRDRNGMHRWAGNKPRLEDDIRLSLGSRDEDAGQ